MDAAGGAGDEPVRDRLPGASRRRLFRFTLVHADGRDRPLRPRDPRKCPRVVGRRASGTHGTGHLPHAVRSADGHPARRLDRDGLPRRAGRTGIRAGMASRRPRGRAEIHRTKPLRLPHRSRRGGDSAALDAGPASATGSRRPRRDRHCPGGDRRIRFRVAFLRARYWHRRGSRDRFRPLLPGALLATSSRQGLIHRVAGLPARRPGPLRSPRRSRAAMRSGRDGHAGKPAGATELHTREEPP